MLNSIWKNGLVLLGTGSCLALFAATEIVWHEVSEPEIAVEGFYWYGQDRQFRRLPREPEVTIRPAVSSLAGNTAGGQLRFQTDSSEVWIDAEFGNFTPMPHMAPTGSSGFDLYTGTPFRERFVTSARPSLAAGVTQLYNRVFPFSDPAPKKMRSFIINFPLYNPVASLRIGLDADAKLLAPEPYKDPRPIAIYGTSITQGGCASRPGSAVSNILSRKLARPVLNFGFSGNGNGEPELAQLLAEIADPAMYILDYEANSAYDILNTLPVFVKILREKHPDTPILVISGTPYSFETYDRLSDDEEYRSSYWHELAHKQQAIVQQLRDAGDQNIHYFYGGDVWGENEYEEMTVDGVHPTDYGFFLMARAWEPKIREILEGGR